MSLAMGIIGCFVGWAFGEQLQKSSGGKWHVEDNSVLLASTTIGIIVGAMVSHTLINVLDSAVAMVYVCFAEDPDILKVRYALHNITLVHS